jgi:predicted RNA-binding Zn-ribbon protein involved in translation (DUF1610 family)
MSEAKFDFVKCPTCGGRLRISRELERFACLYCGIEHTVRRSGGVIALSLVVDGNGKVQAGTGKTAAELALERLGSEIANLESERQAVSRGDLSQEVKIGSAGVSLAFFVFIGVLVGIGADPGVIFFFFPLAFCGGWVGVYYYQKQHAQAVRAELDAQIASKLEEYEKQTEIVDGKRNIR